MQLPDYWLTRPAAPDPAAPAAFDALLQETLHNGGGSIPYTLPYPKWQFLCHIADHHPIALHGPYYIFSISRTALPHQPWRTGSVYLLPRDTFTSQPPIPFGNQQVQVAQLASPHPVQPLAKLTVTPQDFPFLHQIGPHDDARLPEYAAALQAGAPWPEDL